MYLQTDHSIPTNGYLNINFPSDQVLSTSLACYFKSTTTTTLTSTTCDVTGNIIKLKILSAHYPGTNPSSTPLQIKIGLLSTPSTPQTMNCSINTTNSIN